MNACVANLETPKKENKEPKPIVSEQPETKDANLFTKFTNAMKNLFTDTNGDENVRKQNNDLQ